MATFSGTSSPVRSAGSTKRTAKRDYLRFVVGNDDFVIPLRDVVEIVNYGHVTPIPGCAPWIRGLFNLRGQVLPVSDLALRIGLPSQPVTRKTVLVVLRVNTQQEAVEFALVVDFVREVVAVEDDAKEQVPPFGLHLKIDYLNGLIRHDGVFLKSVNLATLVGHVPADAVAANVDDNESPADAALNGESEAAQAATTADAINHEALVAAQELAAAVGASETTEGLFLFDEIESAA